MRKLRRELAGRASPCRRSWGTRVHPGSCSRGPPHLISFVVDSSVALAWILPNEQDARADALADALETAPASAPTLWSLEVANALLTAQRRKRLTDREAERLFKVLEALPIEFDSAPPLRLRQPSSLLRGSWG